MTWEDLKPEHVQALKETIDRQGVYLFRLLKRLEELGLPPADPLYRHVDHAAAGIEGLRALLRDYHKPRASPPTTAAPTGQRSAQGGQLESAASGDGAAESS
jgi:hypothetical protein